MNINEDTLEYKRSYPIAESVGSYAEMTRAIQVRYYRTVCPAEVGRTIDPPGLVANLLTYSHICKENKWPVVVLRPELKRASWGVLVMHPTRALLDIAVNPSRLIDKIYRDTLKNNEPIFKSCSFVHIVNYTYRVYQGLTLPAGETLAWCMAEALGQHTGAMSNA